MNYLLRSQWRDLISRPVATIALLLNLTLALFAITTVHVVSHTLVHEFAQVQLRSGYHYVIPFADQRESSYFALRARWRAGELPIIIGMVPVIEGNLQTNGRAIPLIGIDLVSDSIAAIDLNNAQAQTEFLTQDTVIVFGDDLVATTFPSHIKVMEYRSGEHAFLLADIATAQKLLHRTGEIDAVWLRYDKMPTWEWMEHLSPGITTGFGFRGPVITLPDLDIRSMSDWQPTQVFAGSIAFNIGLLGMLAVLVSGFIVYEMTVRSVRRRAREFNRLQTIGVTALQIRSVLLLESIVLVILAALVSTVLAFLFLEQNTLISKVTQSTFLIANAKGAFLGISTALVGVMLAFARGTGRFSGVVLLCSLVLAAAMFYCGVWMTNTLVGAYLAVLALCVLHIVVLTPTVVQTINALVSRLRPKGLITRLNLRALSRHVQQSHIAVIAFSLAIATAIGITVMISSLRTDFFYLLEVRLPPGVQVRDAGNVDPVIIRQWRGVEDVREYFRGDGTLSTGKTTVVATTLDEFEARRYGFANDSEQIGIYVNEKIATESQIQVGDELSITLPGLDPMSFPVIHVFKSYGDMSRVVLLPQDQIPSGSLVRDRLLIVVHPNSFSSVEQQLLEEYPGTTVLNHRQIRERAVDIFDKTFALTNLIAFITVVVAVIGLFNAALAMQSAKKDEYRLLNSLGFSRFALFRQSFSQAILLGLVCCLLSVPLGLAVAWILCELVNPRAFQWTIGIHIAPTAVAYPLFLGLGAATLASVLPWFLVRRNSQ